MRYSRSELKRKCISGIKTLFHLIGDIMYLGFGWGIYKYLVVLNFLQFPFHVQDGFGYSLDSLFLMYNVPVFGLLGPQI